jgi:hypothetical protein
MPVNGEKKFFRFCRVFRRMVLMFYFMKNVIAWVLGVLVCFGGNVARAQLLISEYVEGSSNNKALEIWNVSATSVTFGTNAGQLDVKVLVYVNGSSTPSSTISLTPGASIAAGDVYVLANPSATFVAIADQTSTSATWNGDDAIVLMADGVVLDSIGRMGEDPGSAWMGGGMSTQDHTLRLRASVIEGDTIVNDPYDPSIVFEGYAVDAFDDLGVSPLGVFLRIQRSDTNAVMSWPASVNGYQLQSTTNLLGSGTVWSDVNQTPAVSGARQTVTNNDLLLPKQFYRLRK